MTMSKRIEIYASDHAIIKTWAKQRKESIKLIIARMVLACMNTNISCPDEEEASSD